MKGVSDQTMISFIIPAYNAEKTIGATIESIGRLPLAKEIIVVENGSTDGTLDKLREYKDIIILQSEKGVSKARNLGLKHAKGEWICFVDADDECLTGTVTALEAAMEHRPDLLVAGYLKDQDIISHKYNHRLLSDKTDLEKAKEWMISKPTLRMQAWAKLFKRQFLIDNKLRFDESLSYSEDSEFVIRVLVKMKSMLVADVPIYQYKSGTSSAMRSYSDERIAEYIKALRKAKWDLKSESRLVKRAFRDYVIAHLNIMAVHDIFGYDVELSWKARKQKMANLLENTVIYKAVRTLNILDISNPNNLPALLFKRRLISLGGLICLFRSLQNKRRYKKAAASLPNTLPGKSRDNKEKDHTGLKRILVFGMTENPGGVESFLLGYYRNIDREKVQFDFLCNSHDPVAHEDELIALGGRTYHITARSQNMREYKKQLDQVFKDHAAEWDAIWVNVCSLANIDYLKIAKRYGIKTRIIHSHNSQNMDSFLRGILHHINRFVIQRYATDFWACSEDAARWFYRPRLLKKAVVIHNAIDVQRISYDEEKREAIRQGFEISDDTFVIGNIGRLHFQKNQSFMLDIFKEYLSINPDAVLILVGQGEDEASLKAKCKDLGIKDKVIFTGVQKDIQGWLSAFDLFLFPSKFEGLSIAALEAQANGVPVLASEKVISPDLKINDNFIFFSLDQGEEVWAGKLEEVRDLGRESFERVYAEFEKKGFDVITESKKLESFFVSL